MSSAKGQGALTVFKESRLEAGKGQDDVDYKVIKKTSIDTNMTMDCICDPGKFWHYRINACVKQGGWGYECGYFPGEHHNMVCIDGMKCQALKKTQIEYNGYPGAKPANCQKCEEEDKCLTGEKRRKKTCLKEYILSGSACQTVRVTTMHTATETVTETVTKKSSASADATATASHKATVTEEHTAEGPESKVSATEKATASATKEATAKGKATVEASAEHTASANHTANEQGEAEAKACVTVDEVKEFMELKKVRRMPAVLSAKVVSTGDRLAFDKAYAKALAAAQKAGLLNAKEAAKAAASAKAREHAGLEAKAKADEAAAWKAEAGAKKDAQEKAKADALAKAEAAARAEAAAKAKAAAEAAAKAAAAEKAAAEAAAKAAAEKDAAKAAAAAAAKADAAKAKADADAAAAAAAEAKAKQQAISDVVNKKPTQAPERPTTPTTTLAPRKIPAKDIAAKLP